MPARSTEGRPPAAVHAVAAAAFTALSLAACGDGAVPATAAPELRVTEVAGAGLLNPGAVLADTAADLYLVSSVGGPPGERNARGFISRFTPDGELLDLHWIRPVEERLVLHSPKGMAIRGDSLFVANLDCVIIFHRTSGQPLARQCIQGAHYLSDVDVGPEGSIFVVDTGLSWGAGGLEPTGTDAVYRLVLEEGRRGATLARSADLGRPAGIAVGSRGIFVSTSGSGEIFRLTPAGERSTVYPRTGRALDGIVFLPDGGFAFSARDDGVVFRVDGEGRVERLLEGIPGVAGLGYDPVRNRLLVSLMEEDRILLVDLP